MTKGWGKLEKGREKGEKKRGGRGDERWKVEKRKGKPVGLVGDVNELRFVRNVLLLQGEQHSLTEWTCHFQDTHTHTHTINRSCRSLSLSLKSDLIKSETKRERGRKELLTISEEVRATDGGLNAHLHRFRRHFSLYSLDQSPLSRSELRKKGSSNARQARVRE